MKLALGGGVTSRGWRGSWIPATSGDACWPRCWLRQQCASRCRPCIDPPSPRLPREAGDPAQALLSGLRPGQVAAPIRLVDPGPAPLLRAGVAADVLATPDSPGGGADAGQNLARVVARDVRVLAAPASSASDSSLGTLLVLAVGRLDAQALAGAESGGRLSVTLESG